MNHDIASNEVGRFDTAAALREVTDTATRVLGSRDLGQHWLVQPALALDGQRPLDLLGTASGLEAVKTLLTPAWSLGYTDEWA
ncbi:MAG: MbcA/ParS/Xre antitoxin family protein [Burkholderiaceae bacterium]|nr:MbcA/ParS/Xre antitoxin family protein [Burkholderiaceae bacterium]